MTTALPKLNIDLDLLPDELTLVSLEDREIPSWLVWSYTTWQLTFCDICHEFIGQYEMVYCEPQRHHPAHQLCWITQLPARPVRVVSVRYH